MEKLLPNGEIGVFPDTMTEDQVNAVIMKQFGGLGANAQQGPQAPMVSKRQAGTVEVPLPNGEIGVFPETLSKQQIDDIIRRQFTAEGKRVTEALKPKPFDYLSLESPTREPPKIYPKQIAATALPIAGDIAATALAPEIKGTTTGIKLLNTLIRMGASGLGGGAGELARQKMLGEKLDIKEAGWQGLSGAVGEGTGTALMASGKPLLRETMNIASNLSPLGRMAGKYLKNAQRKVTEKTTGRAFNFMEDLGVIPKEDAGLAVGQALAKKTEFKEIYKPFDNAIDKIAEQTGGEILLEDSSQYIGELIDKFKKVKNKYGHEFEKDTDNAIKEAASWLGYSGDARAVATLREIYKENSIGPNDAKYLMANFWKKSYGKTTDRAVQWKEGLKSAFLGDLEQWEPGAKVAREMADKTYQAINQFLRESPGAKKIIEKMNFGRSNQLYFEAHPDKVAKVIFSRQPDEIRQIRNAVVTESGGQEAWDMLAADYVKDIISSSMRKTKATGKSVLMPMDAAEKIIANEERLKAALPLGSWKKLKDEARFYASVAPQFETISVQDGYDLFVSWSLLKPKSASIIKSMVAGSAKGAKQAGKAGLHITTTALNPPEQEIPTP